MKSFKEIFIIYCMQNFSQRRQAFLIKHQFLCLQNSSVQQYFIQLLTCLSQASRFLLLLQLIFNGLYNHLFYNFHDFCYFCYCYFCYSYFYFCYIFSFNFFSASFLLFFLFLLQILFLSLFFSFSDSFLKIILYS